MAKVTLHHYNWNRGREIDRDVHFSVISFGNAEDVTTAWNNKLYAPVIQTMVADDRTTTEHGRHDVCEAVFADQNADRPRNWRSMSVGDILQIDEKYYLCAGFGFKEIQLT